MDVKLNQLLKPQQICLDLKSTDKTSAIKELVSLADKSKVVNPEELLNCLFEREKLETTGIGDGIALPHGRTDAVSEMILLFGRSEEGIDFQSLDDNLVHIMVMIAAPKNESTKVLKVLAKISRFLNNPDFRQRLMSAKTADEIFQLFKEKEE